MRPTRFFCASFTLVVVVCFGCRGHQFGHVIEEDQTDLVGSHVAGAETFNPLINDAVGKLLGRQHAGDGLGDGASVSTKRIVFLGVENYSAEEMGDFKEQIFEQIDSQISESQTFEPISRRFVEAALQETRLRPDSLFIPANMEMFSATLAQQGQPFEYLLFGKLTSGTTQKNNDFQRDYLLTLELVNVNTGSFDKESAKIRKGYHKTRIGKLRNYNPFTRR